MSTLFEITEADRRCHADELDGFLPRRIVDVHTHVWRASDYPAAAERDTRLVSWPGRVAKDCPIEDLQETYRLMLPGREVTPVIFSNLPRGNIDAVNAYVAESAARHRLPALIFSDPSWSADELERRVSAGGFIGAKSYLSMVPDYIPGREIRILDFFPPHQLEVHNRRGWIIMLHIPRDARLKDPVNLAQMLEIERRYPNVQVIIAHVGRAYCNHDVGNAFEVLASTRRMLFDFSASTNDWVFEQLIRCVGPRRILFGTDLPIARMRMRRVTRDDHYVNIVPRGLYGDVSGDKNMAEADQPEAGQLTFFVYEQLKAFRRAAERTGLSASDVEDVFYGNAMRVIETARRG